MEDALGKRNERFTVALAGIQHWDQAFFINTKNGFTHKLVLALEKRRQLSSLPTAPQTVPHTCTEQCDKYPLSSSAGQACPVLHATGRVEQTHL